MNKNWFIKYISLFLFLIIIAILRIQAQVIDCPPDGRIWTFGGNASSQAFPGMGDGNVLGTVDYYTRNDNGHFEVSIDWNSFINDYTPILKDETIKDILENMIINNLSIHQYVTSGDIYVEYKTVCNKNACCYVKVSQDNRIYCTDAGFGEPPTWFNYLNVVYYCYLHSSTCGYKCCEKVYHYVTYWDTITNQWMADVTGPTIQDYPGSVCTGVSSVNCVTGLPETCGSNCQ